MLDFFKIWEEIIDIVVILIGCYIGGSLLIIDFLNYLLELYGNNFLNEVILSKGYVVVVLYVVFFIKGILKEKLSLFYGIKGFLFFGYLNNELLGIFYLIGSLGYGIGYGVGWVLG